MWAGARFLHMSAIKDGSFKLAINNREYKLLFSLNVLDEVQDKFGSIDNLHVVFNQDNKDWIKNLKWLLAMLINEGLEDGETLVTEQQIGKWIHTGNMADVQAAIIGAFRAGTTGETEATGENETNGVNNTGEEEGNRESGQVS